jgi:hypothetical protein
MSTVILTRSPLKCYIGGTRYENAREMQLYINDSDSQVTIKDYVFKASGGQQVTLLLLGSENNSSPVFSNINTRINCVIPLP